MAADCTGATISAILPAVNADTIKDVLALVLGKDVLLVTDGASFDRLRGEVGCHP